MGFRGKWFKILPWDSPRRWFKLSSWGSVDAQVENGLMECHSWINVSLSFFSAFLKAFTTPALRVDRYKSSAFAITHSGVWPRLSAYFSTIFQVSLNISISCFSVTVSMVSLLCRLRRQHLTCLVGFVEVDQESDDFRVGRPIGMGPELPETFNHRRLKSYIFWFIYVFCYFFHIITIYVWYIQCLYGKIFKSIYCFYCFFLYYYFLQAPADSTTWWKSVQKWESSKICTEIVNSVQKINSVQILFIS